MLSDDFLKRFDLCLGINYVISIVSRTLECEAWQITKCLSTNYQRHICLAKIQILENYSSKRCVEVQIQTDDIHLRNISCTENMLNNVDLRIIPYPHPQYPDFNLLPLHVFVRCSRPMLRAFIYMRMFDKFKSCIEPGFKWSKTRVN